MSTEASTIEFNYCVGHFWNESKGSIGAYAYHSEVQYGYGTLKDARNFLKYVKSKSPEHDWKIFQLVEVPY